MKIDLPHFTLEDFTARTLALELLIIRRRLNLHKNSVCDILLCNMVKMKYLSLYLLLVALSVVAEASQVTTKKSCDELKAEYDDFCKKHAIENPGDGIIDPQKDFFEQAFSSCVEAKESLCSTNKDHRAGCCTDNNECENVYWDWINQCALAEEYGLDCACPKKLSTSQKTMSRGLQGDIIGSFIQAIGTFFQTLLCIFSLGSLCPNLDCVENEEGEVLCPGRPFRDDQDNIVEASAHICDASSLNPTWSKDDRIVVHADRKIQQKTTAAADDATELANEWTRRAIGEHASIASFASFVINLMTNQAPPYLIRQALAAAQDELNHATMTFTMASLLFGDGTNREPGPLPPTAVSFTNNLTALGIATVREGCIAETLSALTLADEVAEGMARWDELGALDKSMVEATGKIADDEGNHSALAWNTIRWICQTEPAPACKAMQDILQDRSRILLTESASPSVIRAWNTLVNSMVPFVLRGEATTTTAMHASKIIQCSNQDGEKGPIPLSTLNADSLAHGILERVLCGDDRADQQAPAKTASE